MKLIRFPAKSQAPKSSRDVPEHKMCMSCLMKLPTAAHCRPHLWSPEILRVINCLICSCASLVLHWVTDWRSASTGALAFPTPQVSSSWFSAAQGDLPRPSHLSNIWQMQHPHLGMGEKGFRCHCLAPRHINNSKRNYIYQGLHIFYRGGT